MYLLFSDRLRVLQRDNQTIFINRLTGDWVKLSSEVASIFQYADENQLTLEKLIECVQKEDVEFISETASKLYALGLVSDREKKERDVASISYSITHRCNLHCTHCIVDAVNSTIDDFFSTSETIQNLQKIIEANPRSIVITGGEPLVRTDFMEIVEFCRGHYSGHLSLMTNGTLINQELAQFISSNFNSCSISLDGYNEETCARIRGPGVFAKAINGITLLQLYGLKSISTSMVLSGDNTNYVDEYIELNHQMETKPMLRAISFSGRAKTNEVKLKETSVGTTSIKVHQEKNTARIRTCTCSAGYDQCVVEANGDIFPCNLFTDLKYKLGNIIEIQSLKELLCNTSGNNFLSDCLTHLEPSCYARCQGCDVSYFCWSCLHAIEELPASSFNSRCKMQKAFLEKVWNEL